jgi:hypothetical protein
MEQTNGNYLKAKEVKRMLNCGLSTVYDLFENKQLRGFRLPTGGKKAGIRIFPESVKELIERNTNVAKTVETPAVVPQPAPARTRPSRPPSGPASGFKYL